MMINRQPLQTRYSSLQLRIHFRREHMNGSMYPFRNVVFMERMGDEGM